MRLERRLSPAVLLFVTSCAAGASLVELPTRGGADGAEKTDVRSLEAPTHDAAPARVAADQGTLDERIARAERAAITGMDEDALPLVELSRLQLLRNNAIADPDGENDVARATRNAMRAVAIDATSPQARFALALALARWFAGRASDDSLAQAVRLRLITISLLAVPPSDTVDAINHVLAGYIELESNRRARAKTMFEVATMLDPDLSAAWMGLGDTARNAGRYEHASEAYARALALAPDDPEINASLAAASRKERLEIETVDAGTARSLDNASPLATPPSGVSGCSAAVAVSVPNQDLCAGLMSLESAQTATDRVNASITILTGFDVLRPACEKKHTACGDHVAAALAAASRGFRAAGRMAKSIDVAKLLLANAGLPGAASHTQAMMLEVADQYFALGMLDEAADYYERYAKKRGIASGQARERAASLRRAFKNLSAPPAKKAPSGSSPCPSALICGVLRIANEPRWAQRKP